MKTKSKLFTVIGVITFAVAVAFSVNANLDSDPKTNLALANIEALANGEYGVDKCPGGSCTFTNSFNETCTACCPKEKNPRCNTFGCECY